MTGKIGFKHGIYLQFTLEAGRLSSNDFNNMYRDRCRRYRLPFASKGENGRINKVLEMWSN